MRKRRFRISGFTLIELLVVVAIMAVLISILLPALQAARDQTRSVECMARMKVLVMANLAYADDNDAWLTHVGGSSGWDFNWHTRLAYLGYTPMTPKADNLDYFSPVSWCPLIQPLWYSYSIGRSLGGPDGFAYMWQVSRVQSPSQKILVGDSRATNGFSGSYGIHIGCWNWWRWFGIDTVDGTDARHLGRANFGFYDAHVGVFSPMDRLSMSFDEMSWNPAYPE